MANENDAWVMHGMDWDDPNRIKTYRELIGLINETGFWPLFKNEIVGFSAEEHVSPLYWWTGDQEQDPWQWREMIAGTGEVACGRFFGRKAGVISMEWLPAFVNFRRDGYDFDARLDDDLANIITDLQMQTYLCIKEFRRKRNRKGQEYGMPVCVYCRPEDLWGCGMVTGAYSEDPLASKEKICSRLKELYPDADGKAMDRMLR